jgi:hypothetical protein
MADEQQQVTMQFEIVKHVTLPLMKLGAEPTFVKFIGAIFQADNAGKERKAEEGKTPMPPPELAHVFDLARKIPAQIIINAVLGSELRKAYPNDSYIDKSFRIAKTQVQGKRYATFEILEIKLKGDANDGKVSGKK